ncbi:hypothetical protein V8C86DRAFT_2822891 [Haematococcus lacustris]
MELQARVVARALSGAVDLPSRQAMEDAVREEAEAKCRARVPARHWHTQGPLQWGYNQQLAALAGPDTPAQPRWRQLLYNATGVARRSNLERYRDLPLPELEDDAVSEMEDDIRQQLQQLQLWLEAQATVAAAQ